MLTTQPITIVVERTYAASPEAVFDAWLDLATAGRWLFATPGGEMQRVEIDPRIGGEFLIVERREAGDAEHFGTYREIDRPRRLAFTFAAMRDVEPTLVTIEIAPTEAGCGLKLTHQMDPRWAEYKARTREGWAHILAGLAGEVEPERDKIGR